MCRRVTEDQRGTMTTGANKDDEARAGAGEVAPAPAPVATPAPRKPKAPKPTVAGAPVVASKKPATKQPGAKTAATAAVTKQPGAKKPATPKDAAPVAAAPGAATTTVAPKAPKPKASGPKRPHLKVAGSRSMTAEDREADKKSLGQARQSVVFLACVTVAYVIYLVISGQMDEFLRYLATADKRWIAGGLLIYVAYYVLGVSAYVLSVIGDPDSPVGIRDLMSVEASGIFFMNLTPNGAGAAPAQIYRLMRSGLSVGGAGSLQYTRFIAYESGEGIFAALMLIFRGQYFVDTFDNVFVLGAILFGFKILECAALLVICLWPNVVMRVGNAVLNFANKRGWVKDYDRWHKMINEQVKEFSDGFKKASANVGNMVATFIVTLLQLACLYSIAFFVLKALGRPADLVTCLASGAMLELLTSAIPLPGGTGGAEGGFAVLFGSMFGEALPAGYVLWRALEYFIPTLAASTLLGLRSNSHESINKRWNRFRGRVQARTRRGRKQGAGTIKVRMRK